MQNTKQPNTKQDKKTIHRVHCAVTDTTPTQSHNQIHTDTSCTPQIDVSVVDSGGETPGPIPNPEAKPARADGTAPGRRWESRLPPTQQLHTNTRHTPTQLVCGGCSLYPAPSTHHARASRTLHCRHRRHPTDSATRTPRQAGRLSPVTDNTGNALRTPRLRTADNAGTYRFRNADIPAGRVVQSHCGLRQSALRTRQVPTHSAMQTCFAVRKGFSFCCGLRHRIADSWIVLDCGLSQPALQTLQVPTHSTLWTCQREGGMDSLRTVP